MTVARELRDRDAFQSCIRDVAGVPEALLLLTTKSKLIQSVCAVNRLSGGKYNEL